MAALNIEAITGKAKGILSRLTPYARLLFIVLLIAMYSFLVFRIKTLTGSEPTEDAINEKLETLQRPKVDQSIVDKITQLQDNSVEVKTLFQAARDNPFQE